MSQPPSFSDCFVAPCQRLVGIAETEKDNAQDRLCVYVGVDSYLVHKRAVGIAIIKRKDLFEMRSG
jgi:hypothetical protein